MFDDIPFTARDGTRLYARRFRGGSTKRPVLCIPSLVGNSGEFDVIARALSQNGPDSRSVYCIDCRGRGRSRLGPGGKGSSMVTECEDILELVTLAGLDDVAVLGNGYGGQLAMILALLRPSAVGAVVLNDSGPEFQIEGIVRLYGEVASMPLPQSWADAAAMLKGLHGRRYPGVAGDEWMALAKSFYPEVKGRPARAYDPSIAVSHSLSRGTAHQQTMWPQFSVLNRRPVLLLRAELSDMLGEKTVARMRDANPNLEETAIPRQGHPALLRDAASIGAVNQFLLRHDAEGATENDRVVRAVA